MTKKLSTAALRKQNRSNVYQYFYRADAPKTKQDVARDLSLSLPTVTQNLRELLEAGLIAYAGFDESSGGRRARTMQLAADARFAVGVELSPKHIHLTAIDLKAREIAYRRLECPFSNDEAYRVRLAQSVEAFLGEQALPRARLLGVGLTLPGVIDEANGVIEIAPVLRVRKMNLSLLTDLLPYPVHVENDASAGGYAEWWNRGGADSMAYLFLGKGVGGALLIDGKPYAGKHGRSAEFGHMCIVPDGRLCSCGKRGCLEAYCSTARLSDDFGIRLEDFFAGLQDGNAQYFAVWQRYLDDLATGINTIRMMLDSEVVLGGVLNPFIEAYLPDLHARLRARNGLGDEACYLHLGACRAKANCIGVALHFVDRMLAEL